MQDDFIEKLESLVEQGADDFVVSKLFKTELVAYYESLASRFSPSYPRAFLVAHARAIEHFIAAFYRFVLRGSFGNFTPEWSTIPIAFIALGSFGREQCAPYSDVDLMIVFKETAGYNLKPIIERVLYLAWDSGFRLGHRVHEIGELRTAAQSDITIKTAMLEGRFILGSRLLWIETEGVLDRIRAANRDDFVAETIAQYRARKAKKPIVMEPDIKECAGGLRDTNALFWIAKAIYGVSTDKDLVARVVSEDDYREYHQSAELLYRVRIALHILEKKKLDTLLFQRQREIALFLGFRDTKMRKAERFLLQRVLGALKTIDRHCDYYIEKIAGGLKEVEGRSLRKITKEILKKPVWSDFDIAIAMQIRRAARLGGAQKQTILEIFSRPDCHKIIELFDRAGRLEALLPPLKTIISLAQFDGYHDRPVDEHSILTLKNLAFLEGGARELFDGLSAEDRLLLRLVALLHDCGKGGARSHSEIGAMRFRKLANLLGIAPDDGMLLIRTHTLMSNVSRNEDIYSDRVVFAFATKLGSKRLVTMLYLLTICDMSAVAQGVYSHFAANLLRDLYLRAIEALDKNDQMSEAALRIKRERALQSDTDFLALDRRLRGRVLSIGSALFFLKFKPLEIVNIAKMVEETQTIKFSAVSSPSLSIDIIAKKPFNLGWFLGKLSRFDLGAMDIFRLFDGAKLFRIFFRKPFDEPIALIASLTESALDMSRTMKYARPIIKKKEIEIDCDHSLSYARMSLNVSDQQGLMAFIIDIFDRREIDIAAAKIATVKNRANNLFLIEKTGTFCANKDAIAAEIIGGKYE
ncbi:nucleotidyltransferase [Campylobacterota bacterium]|nr:nucleotidyltransferase [Campylobacterota bacterium]